MPEQTNEIVRIGVSRQILKEGGQINFGTERIGSTPVAKILEAGGKLRVTDPHLTVAGLASELRKIDIDYSGIPVEMAEKLGAEVRGIS